MKNHRHIVYGPLMALFILLLPGLCFGQASLRLTGVFNVSGKHTAVVEVSESRSPFGLQPVTKILGEQERDGDLEVIAVDLAQATAQARYRGSNYSLVMPTNENTKGLTVQLANVPLSAVLKLYAELTGLTLLQHPELTEEKLSITSTISDRPALAVVFAVALTNAGVVSISDGDKFLRILPAAQAEEIQRIQIPARGTNEVGSAQEFPAGAISFARAKLEQAARIQVELIRRKFDPQQSRLSAKDIDLQTQQPLTRAEIIHALDVHFAWRGVKLVPVDDKLARLVPLNEN